MTSVGGPFGGGNAQTHFLQIVEFRKLNIMPQTGAGQMKIQRWAGNYFNDDGKLIDEDTKKKLIPFLDAFAQFIERNRKKN